MTPRLKDSTAIKKLRVIPMDNGYLDDHAAMAKLKISLAGARLGRLLNQALERD